MTLGTVRSSLAFLKSPSCSGLSNELQAEENTHDHPPPQLPSASLAQGSKTSPSPGLASPKLRVLEGWGLRGQSPILLLWDQMVLWGFPRS